MGCGLLLLSPPQKLSPYVVLLDSDSWFSWKHRMPRTIPVIRSIFLFALLLGKRMKWMKISTILIFFFLNLMCSIPAVCFSEPHVLLCALALWRRFCFISPHSLAGLKIKVTVCCCFALQLSPWVSGSSKSSLWAWPPARRWYLSGRGA